MCNVYYSVEFIIILFWRWLKLYLKESDSPKPLSINENFLFG